MQSSEKTLRDAIVESAPASVPVGPAPELGHGEEEEHIHLAPSSVWPITLAAGITIIGLGFVTETVVSGLGVIISIIAIIYWVQELRHELH